MSALTAIILAAGKGTRMKSDLPKVLHKVSGLTMIDRVAESCMKVTGDIVFVVGSRRLKSHLKKYKKCRMVFQMKKLGTADALLKTEKLFKGKPGRILVIPGDAPLVTGNILRKFISFDGNSSNDISILTAVLKNPSGYGRIIKKRSLVSEIREELDASPSEKKIKTVNGGIYIFRSPEIFSLLKKVPLNPVKKEYYLTDVVKIAGRRGLKVKNLSLKESSFIIGINSKEDLAEAEKLFKPNVL